LKNDEIPRLCNNATLFSTGDDEDSNEVLKLRSSGSKGAAPREFTVVVSMHMSYNFTAFSDLEPV